MIQIMSGTSANFAMLERSFKKWLYLGIGIFILMLLIPLIAQPFFCKAESQHNEWGGNAYYNSNKNTNSRPTIQFHFESGAEKDKKQTAPVDQYYLPSWVCKPTKEIRATDLAIVFFTYVLGLVGLYQLRSADENTKRAERAYIVVGPLYGIPKRGMQEHPVRPSAEMYKGPWRITVFNFGRTAGYSTKIEWGICEHARFDDLLRKGKSVSDIVKNKLLTMNPPITNQYIFSPEGRTPYQLRDVLVQDRADVIGKVIFGRVDYMDVFGTEHYSTFSYFITRERSESIGRSLSDDYD